MNTFVDRLTHALVEQGAISPERAAALQKSFHEAGKPNFDNFLLEGGLVYRDDLLKALAQVYQVPSFDAVGYLFRYHLLHMFPKDFLLRNAVIPVEVDENMLMVCASNPEDPDLLSKLGKYVSYDIRLSVGIRPDITGAVQEFYDRDPSFVSSEEVEAAQRDLEQQEGRVILEEEELEEIQDWESRENK